MYRELAKYNKVSHKRRINSTEGLFGKHKEHRGNTRKPQGANERRKGSESKREREDRKRRESGTESGRVS